MDEESQKERLSVRNSIDELLPLAEAGDLEAQYCLAKKILGDSLIRIPPIDQAAGVTWLLAAAQGGHIASQKALAWMYRFGQDGVEKDLVQALRYYEMAAEQHDPETLMALGDMFSRSTPGEATMYIAQDVQKAVNYYRRAAELDWPYAQTKLGALYEEGIVVQKDAAEALRWYERAAKNGDEEAAFAAGRMLAEAPDGIVKDVHAAIAYWEQSALQCLYEAQIALSDVYQHGDGVPQDLQRAYHYRVLAAANSDSGDDLATAQTEIRALAQELASDALMQAREQTRAWVRAFSDPDAFRHIEEDLLVELLDLKQASH